MKKQINQVKDFHTKFNIYQQNNIQTPPFRQRELRERLIREEYFEVKDEILSDSNLEEEPNLDKVAKELCDLLYVVYGTVLTYGLQDKIEECFDEVHRSNMSKLGKDGKPVYREDGKLMKGDNYSPANIQNILK
jgi:predicted HAD superfamily Cof-like phosphohydrolase